jgi:hypothetical protein
VEAARKIEPLNDHAMCGVLPSPKQHRTSCRTRSATLKLSVPVLHAYKRKGIRAHLCSSLDVLFPTMSSKVIKNKTTSLNQPAKITITIGSRLRLSLTRAGQHLF